MSAPAENRVAPGRLARWWRGLGSALSTIGVPLGNWWCGSIDHLATAERQAAGLVLVLPGVEGRSALNLGIALGLDDGGVSCAVEVHDWTTGRLFLWPYHLRGSNWHARQAARLAKRITDYQYTFPGRPVVLVGHSGGAAMSLLALAQLDDCKISGAVLLAAAVSPKFDTRAARRRAERGIWSFHSPLDWFQLGLGTLVLGTVDGKHAVSAGMVGFREKDFEPDAAPLHQIPFGVAMAASWHFGGHWGWANRVFASEWLAPVVLESCAEPPG